MTYLAPQAFDTDAGTLASVTAFGGLWYAGTGRQPVRGFRAYIRDLNMDSTAERPTLRLRNDAGSQVSSSIYNYEVYRKDHNATYSQGSITQNNSQTWWDPQSFLQSVNIVHGFYEGHCVDFANNKWCIYALFRDDASAHRQMEMFGDVTLTTECGGFLIQSGNASAWSGGTYNYQYWR